MEIRKLDPTQDLSLFSLAFQWRLKAPRWLRDGEAVFGAEDFEAFARQATEQGQADFGVFEGGRMVAHITLSLRAKGTVEAHLNAERGTPALLVARSAYQLRARLFAQGVREIFVWVASRNRPVRALCRAAGLLEDGVTVLKGATHGRVIEWLRMSCTGEA